MIPAVFVHSRIADRAETTDNRVKRKATTDVVRAPCGDLFIYSVYYAALVYLVPDLHTKEYLVHDVHMLVLGA